MKRSLLLMGLALCPVWATAQVVPDVLWNNADASESLIDEGLQSWQTDAELSPNAVPNTDWANVTGHHFRGFSSDFNGSTWIGGGLLCWTGSTNRTALARLDIPHGRKINYLRLWGYDNSSTGDLRANLWESCLPDIAPSASPTITQLGTVTSSGAPGNFTLVSALSPIRTANAHVCTYWAEVVYAECGTSVNLQARKIRVEHTK